MSKPPVPTKYEQAIAHLAEIASPAYPFPVDSLTNDLVVNSIVAEIFEKGLDDVKADAERGSKAYAHGVEDAEAHSRAGFYLNEQGMLRAQGDAPVAPESLLYAVCYVRGWASVRGPQVVQG